MYMFCTKCGNQNMDGVKFCTTCGAPLETTTPSYSAAPSYAPSEPFGGVKKPDNKIIKLAAIIVAAIAVVAVVAVILVSKTGVNGTINKIEKGLKKCDIEMLLEACVPKEAIDEMIEDEFDGDKSEYKDQIEEWEDEAKDILDDEEIKFVSIEKIGKVKSFKKSEIEDFGFDSKSDMLDAIEDEFEIDNVKDVKKCKVKLTYKVDGDKENVKGEAYFYKAGGKWYFLLEGSPILTELGNEFSSLL